MCDMKLNVLTFVDNTDKLQSGSEIIYYPYIFTPSREA